MCSRFFPTNSGFAPCALLTPVAVIAEHIEFALDEAAVRTGEIGERLRFADLHDVRGSPLGQSLGFLGRRAERGQGHGHHDDEQRGQDAQSDAVIHATKSFRAS